MRAHPAVLLAALVAAPLAARADGAFPNELQVFAPTAAPNTLVMGANFGVVQSYDSGHTWTFVCEGMLSAATLVTMYQLGPDGSLFGIYGGNVSRSTDHGCTWNGSNTIAGSLTQDLFVDPLSAQNVWVIADGIEVGAPNALYLSTDGGATFGAPSYVEPTGYLNGIEASHTEGVAIASGFLSTTDGGNDVPYLLRTEDLGATWTRTLHPEVAPRKISIAQVDPANDQIAYLRLSSTGKDALAITQNGGVTLQILLELPEAMSSFALGGDGTLYVGTLTGHLWVRAPGATAFTMGKGPMFRCLAERAGTLYACGDDLLDGYALGLSTDHGATFQSLLRLQDIADLQACDSVKRQCTVPLQMLQSIVGFETPTSSSSGGSTGSSGGGGKSGCSCSTAPGLGLLVALAALRRRRRA